MFTSAQTTAGWTVAASSGFIAETRFSFSATRIPGVTQSSPPAAVTAVSSAAETSASS